MDNRDEAAIRARAHQLWVESGYADGYQDRHWRQAEREVAERGATSAQKSGDASGGASGTASGNASGGDAGRRDRSGARDGRHSDGMSAHPSVLDPAPKRARG